MGPEVEISLMKPVHFFEMKDKSLPNITVPAVLRVPFSVAQNFMYLSGFIPLQDADGGAWQW